MQHFTGIADHISQATGKPFKAVSTQSLAGGDINSAYKLVGADKTYFVKLNRADLVDMFAAEFLGLEELANTQTLQVPSPVVHGQSGAHSYLVLECLEFGRSSAASERLFGQQLAALHRLRQPYFGWHRDNTIGSTPQPNQQSADWIAFWRGQRLGFQLNLAAKKGYGGRLQVLGERLLSDLPAFFDGHAPQPSLLHGDLWGGNWAVDKNGRPVIFDPACYYGDREADLAMTELFGGFGSEFYAAYCDAYPFSMGYHDRKTLYNLYHILNHLNLFGGGYLRQAENRMEMLLALIKG